MFLINKIRLRGFTVLTAMLVLIAACNDEVPVEEATEVSNIDSGNIVLKADSEVFTSWEEFYRKDDLAFSVDSFLMTDTIKGELFSQPFVPADSFYLRFGKLLVYNEDSTIFIDPYSSNWIVDIRKNGKLYAREGEVDQEVTMVNTRTNTRTRLLFCGPTCQVQKAFWYNDHIAGIMGLMAEYADEYYTPTIWFVDINNGNTIPYSYHSSISLVQASDYMKRYMESRGLNME